MRMIPWRQKSMWVARIRQIQDEYKGDSGGYVDSTPQTSEAAWTSAMSGVRSQ